MRKRDLINGMHEFGVRRSAEATAIRRAAEHLLPINAEAGGGEAEANAETLRAVKDK